MLAKLLDPPGDHVERCRRAWLNKKIRGILWTPRTNADDRNALFGSVGFHF